MPDSADSSLLGVAFRDLSRLRDVTSAVVRHGFGELLVDTPIGARMFAGSVPPGDPSAQSDSPPIRFARLLAELGPTYIKLGQILSTRRDLIPAEYVAALESLQDEAPPLAWETIRTSVEEGLGVKLEEAFKDFEERPLGTASIAQTHRAHTLAGDPVVVKVQRPGIEATMRGDLDLLYLAAQILEASIDEMTVMAVSDIVTEFEQALLRELDFREELANLRSARQRIDPDCGVRIPRPYPELSSQRILTMELFEGGPLRELEPGAPATAQAVERLLGAAFKQVFVDGFFHGDPHSGNILVGDDATVCMIDLGLMGTLNEEQRQDVVALIIATIAGDSASLARVLLRMGTPTTRVDLAALKREVERIRKKHLDTMSLTEVDSAGLIEDFAAAAQHFRIKLAPEYSILTKAAATLEGVVRGLHPEVDLLAVARPYVEEVVSTRFSPASVLSGLAGELGDLTALARQVPTHLDQVLHDVETGNLQIRTLTPELDEIPGLLHQMGARVSLALLAGALTICTAILAAATPPRWWLALASATGAFVVWSAAFWWHLVGRGKPLRLSPLLRFFRR